MFKGKWITSHVLENNYHVSFVKEFELKGFSNAVIRISGDDYYKLYINGRFVGQGPAPSYSFNYNYNEYDITGYLIDGKNRIEVEAYYQGLVNRVWVSGNGNFGIIADLIIDGKLYLSTDESWLYAIDKTYITGKTYGYDTAFAENRDLRKGKSDFKNAAVLNADYHFKPEPSPALSVYPVYAKPKISGRRYCYDFAQEYVCNVKITALSDKSGKRIIIRCGEETDENGRVSYKLRAGCDYEEYCILDEGENVILQYDYKALRYLEIEAEEGIEIKEALLLVRHYPFPEKSQELKTDNKELRNVWELCKTTVKLGTQETFVDCPTREKGQYLGDVFISGFAHFYLTNDGRLLKKAMTDFASSIEYCGEFLSVAPCAYKQKIADYALLFPYMLLKYYRLTKDKELLSKLLFACDIINESFEKYEDENGLLKNADDGWNLVDWPENMRDDYEQGEVHNVINAYYFLSLKSTEEIKRLLGKVYKEKSQSLLKAYNEAFFDCKTGLYVDSTKSAHSAVHSNILPLAFGLCGKVNEKSVAQHLISRGMVCSVYMSYFYLKALCVSGNKEAALKLIISDGKNSWLNMTKEGATTTFEAWSKEHKQNASLFHPWAVSPILIINEHFDNLLLDKS